MRPPTVVAEAVAARTPEDPVCFAALEACADWHVRRGTSPDTVTLLATIVDSPDGPVVVDVARADAPGLGDGAMEAIARLAGVAEASIVAVPVAALRELLATHIASSPASSAALSPAVASVAWGARVAALVDAAAALVDGAETAPSAEWGARVAAVRGALAAFRGNIPA